jgi:hypothetical protein
MPTSMELATYKGSFSIDVPMWMELAPYTGGFSSHIM